MKKSTTKTAGMIISAVNALVGLGTFVIGAFKLGSDIKKTQAQTKVMEQKIEQKTVDETKTEEEK